MRPAFSRMRLELRVQAVPWVSYAMLHRADARFGRSRRLAGVSAHPNRYPEGQKMGENGPWTL